MVVYSTAMVVDTVRLLVTFSKENLYISTDETFVDFRYVFDVLLNENVIAESPVTYVDWLSDSS